MKYIFILFLLSAHIVYAQNALNGANQSPVKLKDALKEFEYLEEEEEKNNTASEKEIEEGPKYHFGRWKWYWQQHTDQNGNMVSPASTMMEWNKYVKSNAAKEKTSGVLFADWKFEGPEDSDGGYSGIGRINAIEFHPTDANTFWVGSAGGGVWKTTNNGATWNSITDNLPVLSVSDIDVNPLNPNTLYLCTGDRDARDHFSFGVLKSYDGGTTWDTTGIRWQPAQLRLANCLVINNLDTNSLMLAASDGLYKSYNAGKDWTKVRNGNYKQVLYHPTDTNIVYATSFYTSGNASAQIFKSPDGGKNWIQVTNFSESWRITLAVTPADVNVVKAVVASYSPQRYRGLDGVYHSNDAGNNFFQTFNDNGCNTNILSSNVNGSGCTGQGNYDLTIAISPLNANDIVIGGVNTWHSIDGGFNWNIVNQWSWFISTIAIVHADKHCHRYHPLNPTRLFECNDGGIYYTDNVTDQFWNDISNGLEITQFYRNAVANKASFVIGGAQDNGSKKLSNGLREDLTGGDGMDCHIDYFDPSVMYTGVQYGVIYRNINFSERISDNIPGGPEGAWITPYFISPFNHNHLYAGYKEIYFSDDMGDSWTSLNEFLPFPENCLRIAMSPADNKTLYAVLENSNVVLYCDNLNTNSNSNNFQPINPPYTGTISDIKVDSKDSKHFWITFSGFNGPQVAEYNHGTWKKINENLPDVPVLCFEADTANGILYVGTDVGVFYRDSVNKQWELYDANMPVVHVTDLGINYTTGRIWAATYGRGMWQSPKQEYTLGVSTIPFSHTSLTLAPNPSNGKFTAIYNSSAKPNEKIRMKLYDNTGKTIWENIGYLDANKQVTINAEHVPMGNYIFELSTDKMILGRQKVVLY